VDLLVLAKSPTAIGHAAAKSRVEGLSGKVREPQSLAETFEAYDSG
jgi:hypothetical protein